MAENTDFEFEDGDGDTVEIRSPLPGDPEGTIAFVITTDNGVFLTEDAAVALARALLASVQAARTFPDLDVDPAEPQGSCCGGTCG